MKKIVFAALAVVFLSGAAFAAGEINVKFGVDVAGNLSAKANGDNSSKDMNTGINLQGEYLAVLSDIVKVGAGLQYLFPRNLDGVSGAYGLSFLPIYATVEVNPIEAAKEVFFKANLGYGLVFPESGGDSESGLYWAIGAGYNFPFGLIVDLSYGWHYFSVSDFGNSIDYTYSKLGINVGYKFKI